MARDVDEAERSRSRGAGPSRPRRSGRPELGAPTPRGAAGAAEAGVVGRAPARCRRCRARRRPARAAPTISSRRARVAAIVGAAAAIDPASRRTRSLNSLSRRGQQPLPLRRDRRGGVFTGRRATVHAPASTMTSASVSAIAPRRRRCDAARRRPPARSAGRRPPPRRSPAMNTSPSAGISRCSLSCGDRSVVSPTFLTTTARWLEVRPETAARCRCRRSRPAARTRPARRCCRARTAPARRRAGP